MEVKDEIALSSIVYGPKPKQEHFIDMICEAAEWVYPGNWCLDVAEHSLKTVLNTPNRLLIRFPEVNLSNGVDPIHKIEDVFIAIPISKDYSKASTVSLAMIRSTASIVEFNCGYMHSHARRSSNDRRLDSYFTWRGLCLGGQTALTELTYNLNTDGISTEELTKLLLTLSTYVRHESITGGPYFMYRDVKFNIRPNSSSLLNEERLQVLDKRVLKSLIFNDDYERLKVHFEYSIFRGPKVISNNVYSSLNKRVAIELIEMANEGLIETAIALSLIGTINSSGHFISHGSNNADLSLDKAKCIDGIRDLKAFNRQRTDILSFRGVKPEFSIKTEDSAEAETESLSNLSNMDANPEIVQKIFERYSNQLIKFISDEEEYK